MYAASGVCGALALLQIAVAGAFVTSNRRVVTPPPRMILAPQCCAFISCGVSLSRGCPCVEKKVSIRNQIKRCVNMVL